MASEWQELTSMTGKKEFLISRITIKESRIAIEGEFELPPLARIAYEDQVFVAEFIRAHGSIKHMEEVFGVSYPTIKARLNRIASELRLVHIAPAVDKNEVLGRLERGEISAKEALEKLKVDSV